MQTASEGAEYPPGKLTWPAPKYRTLELWNFERGKSNPAASPKNRREQISVRSWRRVAGRRIAQTSLARLYKDAAAGGSTADLWAPASGAASGGATNLMGYCTDVDVVALPVFGSEATLSARDWSWEHAEKSAARITLTPNSVMIYPREPAGGFPSGGARPTFHGCEALLRSLDSVDVPFVMNGNSATRMRGLSLRFHEGALLSLGASSPGSPGSCADSTGSGSSHWISGDEVWVLLGSVDDVGKLADELYCAVKKLSGCSLEVSRVPVSDIMVRRSPKKTRRALKTPLSVQVRHRRLVSSSPSSSPQSPAMLSQRMRGGMSLDGRDDLYNKTAGARGAWEDSPKGVGSVMTDSTGDSPASASEQGSSPGELSFERPQVAAAASPKRAISSTRGVADKSRRIQSILTRIRTMEEPSSMTPFAKSGGSAEEMARISALPKPKTTFTCGLCGAILSTRRLLETHSAVCYMRSSSVFHPHTCECTRCGQALPIDNREAVERHAEQCFRELTPSMCKPRTLDQISTP